MKKLKKYILILLFLIAVIGSTAGCGASDNSGTAENYIKDFLNQEYGKMLNEYDYTASMAVSLNENGLKDAYNKYITPLNQLKSLTYQSTQQGTVSYLTVFQSGSIILNVTFNNKNQISGFHLSPCDDLQMPDNISEKEVKIGSLKYRLTGTLTEPKGINTDTVVILVQGSGPSDRDETIGTLKPFRDIAWSLAKNGVAVFRYDKRTYTYGDKLSQQDDITVYDEVIDDVVYAYNKMKSMGYKKIYIAGHSFGGYLMGRIYKELPSASGYIIMAGNVTPIQDLIVTQIKYIAEFDGAVTNAEQAQINILKIQRDNVNSLNSQNEGDYTKYSLINAPPSYWLDLKEYDPIDTMKQCTGRILILQGAKDYQVTTNEYAKWCSGLEENNNVTYKLYNNLNHLFMASKVMSPDDYNNTNYVDANVINDIYSFINQ